MSEQVSRYEKTRFLDKHLDDFLACISIADGNVARTQQCHLLLYISSAQKYVASDAMS